MSDLVYSPTLSPQTAAGYRLIRDACGLVSLPNRRVIELTGIDRKGWLQGQATNDLRNLLPGGYMQFCLCSPTGQLEGIYGLWNLPDKFVIICDTVSADVLLHRTSKMVVLEDVVAKEPDSHLFVIQGPAASAEVAQFVELPQLDSSQAEIEGTPVDLLRSNRTGSGGWILLAPSSATGLKDRIEKTFKPVDAEAYRIACLEFGTPVMGVDTDSKTLPPELGPAFTSANISYKKGCYVGQEVLMRMYSRGHANRQWMGIYTDELVLPGSPISTRRRADAGTVTSAFESPDFGYIAAGFIRREVAYTGEEVTIQSEGRSVAGELVEMPILRLG